MPRAVLSAIFGNVSLNFLTVAIGPFSKQYLPISARSIEEKVIYFPRFDEWGVFGEFETVTGDPIRRSTLVFASLSAAGPITSANSEFSDGMTFFGLKKFKILIVLSMKN